MINTEIVLWAPLRFWHGATRGLNPALRIPLLLSAYTGSTCEIQLSAFFDPATSAVLDLDPRFDLVQMSLQLSVVASSGVVFYAVCSLSFLVQICVITRATRWLGSRVVSMLDSGADGPGFRSQPRRCRVTVLSKLFTPIVPLFTQ